MDRHPKCSIAGVANQGRFGASNAPTDPSSSSSHSRVNPEFELRLVTAHKGSGSKTVFWRQTRLFLLSGGHKLIRIPVSIGAQSGSESDPKAAVVLTAAVVFFPKSSGFVLLELVAEPGASGDISSLLRAGVATSLVAHLISANAAGL
jgi:hypothetical protein